MLGTKPNCKECDKPRVSAENRKVMYLIDNYSSILIDGMGGISGSSILVVYDIEEVQQDERIILTQKIMIFLNTALAAQRETERRKTHE